MTSLVQVNEGIEGLKIGGSSRKPLQSLGLERKGSELLYKFKAKFNTRAKITSELTSSDTRMEPTFSTSASDEIICDDVLIFSKKNRFTTQVARGSATHQANYWNFPQHTTVRITSSHQDIHNAIQSRARLLSNKTIPKK